ncbi:GNAT family N-acetyltransferase [Telmatobacter sp. DSM 110680]|uniref:GNAT family N-acetyltransferase n=1 Tax=Telmatobacter sp. DSM 110680 TaxID=3036704 RepID=A0AAU7DM97_9BACT
MSVLIRLAEDRDIPEMATLRAQVWETAAFWVERIGLYLRGEHSPQLALRERVAFVAVDAGRIVGFVAGHRTHRHACDGELQWINVDEKLRKRGIAGMLMAAVASWFVQQQALRICVNVAPENAAAREFYAKYGALQLNDHWMIWEDVRVVSSFVEKKLQKKPRLHVPEST